MSTRGRNQYSNLHPNVGQRLSPERDLAKQKGELHMQRDGVHNIGAPHFPPNEGQPAPAKQLASLKKSKKGEKRIREQASARTSERKASEPPPEAYPDALPKKEDARAALDEGLIDRSKPVLRDAQTHWEAVVTAAGRLVSESMQLLRTPNELMRALVKKPRRA